MPFTPRLESLVFAVSTVFMLAAVGNVLATVSIVPHLIEAVRSRKPGGSVTGWLLGAAGGVIWVVYGLMCGTPEVGAPGWLTVPISVVLGMWVWRDNRVRARRDAAKAAHPAFAAKVNLVKAA